MICFNTYIKYEYPTYYLLLLYRLPGAIDTSKKEINELKCQERKMLKQTELIKSALNELGCEEVPSGCDLSIDNQTFISNSSEQVREAA